MRTTSYAALVALFMMWLALPVAAHHSLTAEFENTTTTVKGVMTSIEWINPHIYIYFDVVDNDGKKIQLRR